MNTNLNILLTFYLIFLIASFGLINPVIGQKKLGAKFYSEGKAAYDAKNFNQAIPLFEQALKENPKDYGAKAPYMLALTYVKLSLCGKAKDYFKQAYKADSINGGASARDKFIKKLKECNYTLKDITSNQLKGKTSNFSNRDKNIATSNISSDSSITNENIDNANQIATNNIEPPQENYVKEDSGGFSFWLIFLGIIGVVLVIVYFIVKAYNNRNTQEALKRQTQNSPSGGGYSRTIHSGGGGFVDNTPDILSTFVNTAANIANASNYSHGSHHSSHHTNSYSENLSDSTGTESFSDRS